MKRPASDSFFRPIVEKNYKFYAFRPWIMWLVPFPLLVKLLKSYFGSCVIYQDTTVTIEMKHWYPKIKGEKDAASNEA